MAKKYHYFVGDQRFDTDEQFLTGLQIKQQAGAPATDGLLLEGDGHEPDKLIKDGDTVDLSPSHGGPKHFRLEPPANFGSGQ